MSHPRVLLLYPEFPPSYPSYWNKKFFSSMAPPLGLLTVGALLPEEWQLRLVDENVQALTADDWDWAEVVFLSALFIQRRRLRELITMAKDRGKTVVVGGPYPTVHSQEVLAMGAEMVVRGEFENLLAPFLEAFQADHKGAILESAERPSLANSLTPRFDLLRIDDYAYMVLQTTRGCPFDCEFCDVVRLFGRKPRHKSQEQVLAEMEALYRLGWRREILIGDDNFIGNRSYAKDLLKRMITWHKSQGEPFQFIAQASVNLGQESELIDLMTDANFLAVFLGIESPDEEILKSANKHQNVRHPQAELIKTIIANGLSVMGSFILGFDNESKGAGERIAAFVEATNIPNAVINLLFPFPQTRLWERLKREGRLREDRLLDDSLDLDIFSQPLAYHPTRPESEILQEYLDLWERLYDRGTFLDRTYRFCLAMRPTRRAQAKLRKEAPQPSSPRKGIPWGRILWDLKHFIRLSWSYGVRPPCRWQYWRHILNIGRRNPSRLARFFRSCFMGEVMMHLRDVVRERMQSYLIEEARRGPEANQESGAPGLE